MVTVSVIIPFLNARTYLSEAIASVQAQKLSDWELLLIDDDSTDGSETIAGRAAEVDARIRLLSRPPGAPGSAAAARNLGIQHARGAFVAFLDADDVYERDHLSNLLSAFETHPEVMMVYGPTRWWHPGAEDRDWTDRMAREAGRVHRPPELVNRVLLLQRGDGPCTCGVLVKRRALELVGGFEESFSLYEDQTLWVKLLLRFPVFVTDVVGARYRQHNESATAQSERSGVYDRMRPHQARIAFLDWVRHYGRSSGLTDSSTERALRLASAPYGNGRAMLTTGERWTLARYKVQDKVRWIRRRLVRSLRPNP